MWVDYLQDRFRQGAFSVLLTRGLTRHWMIQFAIGMKTLATLLTWKGQLSVDENVLLEVPLPMALLGTSVASEGRRSVDKNVMFEVPLPTVLLGALGASDGRLSVDKNVSFELAFVPSSLPAIRTHAGMVGGLAID